MLVNEGFQKANGEYKIFFMDFDFVEHKTDIDKFLENLEQILKFFENNKQYILVWNPHPMIYYEMKENDQIERYENLIKSAEHLSNVQCGLIESNLKNTMQTDVFIRSDMFKNDTCSMEEPVYFVNNCFISGDNRDESIYFLDYEYDKVENQVWLVGQFVPGVFSIDLNTWEIRLRYKIALKEQFLTLRKKGCHLYVFRYAAKILDINLDTNEEQEIEFEDWRKYTKFPNKLIIQEILEYNGEYFMIPAYSGLPLLKFNGVRLEECYGWREKVETYLGKDRIAITEGVVQLENKIWMLVPNTNKLIVTDLKTISVEFIEIGELQCKVDIIGLDGCKFWMAPSSESIFVRWSREGGFEQIKLDFPQGFSFAPNHSFVKIVFYKEKVFFIPRRASDILILDKNNEEIRCIELGMFDWGEQERQNFLKFSAVLELDSRLILFACGMPRHLIIDMNSEKIIHIADVTFKSEDLYGINKMYFDNYKMCRSSICRFSQFVEILEQSKQWEEINRNENTVYESPCKCIGETIWKTIKKEL